MSSQKGKRWKRFCGKQLASHYDAAEPRGREILSCETVRFTHLAPKTPITGEDAYRLYMEHTRPHLEKSGGAILFFGRGGMYLIGPSDERWDAAMLVRQESAADFLAFASNREYMSGMGHRVAALEDSRLLPLVEGKFQ